MLGLEGWQSCNRTNATYKECPISQYDTNKTTYVAVHNPSNIPMEQVKVAVKGSQWNMAINGTTVDSHVRCYNDTYEDKKAIENCWLYGKVHVPAHGTAKFQINQANISQGFSRETENGHTITSGTLSAEFLGVDAKEAKIIFNVSDSSSGISEVLEFSMRYWPSFVTYQMKG